MGQQLINNVPGCVDGDGKADTVTHCLHAGDTHHLPLHIARCDGLLVRGTLVTCEATHWSKLGNVIQDRPSEATARRTASEHRVSDAQKQAPVLPICYHGQPMHGIYLDIDEWAARAAGIDGGIRLDEVCRGAVQAQLLALARQG